MNMLFSCNPPNQFLETNSSDTINKIIACRKSHHKKLIYLILVYTIIFSVITLIQSTIPLYLQSYGLFLTGITCIAILIKLGNDYIHSISVIINQVPPFLSNSEVEDEKKLIETIELSGAISHAGINFSIHEIINDKVKGIYAISGIGMNRFPKTELTEDCLICELSNDDIGEIKRGGLNTSLNFEYAKPFTGAIIMILFSVIFFTEEREYTGIFIAILLLLLILPYRFLYSISKVNFQKYENIQNIVHQSICSYPFKSNSFMKYRHLAIIPTWIGYLIYCALACLLPAIVEKYIFTRWLEIFYFINECYGIKNNRLTIKT